jgi:hypothetical protein
MDLGLKIALSVEGFSEAEQSTIEQALPAAERLLDAEKEFAALYAKYSADIATVIPVAKIFLQHAKGKVA